MERASQITLFLLLIIHSGVAQNATTSGTDEFPVGVILDLESLGGKMARTSILMALEDFYTVHRNYSRKVVLHIRGSKSNSVEAASAALDLLENYNVQAVIGPQTSSQAAFVSDLGNKSQVPIISFTATSPSLYSGSLPYFIRATLSDSTQVNSIASLIKAYGWRQVVPIYEETDYGRGVIPYLIDALQEIDARVPYRSVIPLSASNEQITQELYKLMTMQTRVFLVHMSPDLASILFTKAKEVGMMKKGFVWIMTDGLTNVIDSTNPSVMEAMNGVLGVKFYTPKSAELDSFTIRWNRRLQIDNPNDLPVKLNIFELWGYDTIWAVAQAVEKLGIKNKTSFQKPAVARNMTSLGTSVYGPDLLKTILQYKFRGLSGHFDLAGRQLQASTFQIINVVGKGWKEIGFWTAENGISRRLYQGESMTEHSGLVPELNPVIWPGTSTEVPRGWEAAVNGKKLRVGVHVSVYPQFMTSGKDPITGATKAEGLSIDVFEEAVKRLPYALPYEYVAFGTTNDTSTGGYDDFVYQVYLKKYDIAIGDITISENRMSYVDFTLPYTESGVAMVVPAKSSRTNNTWIFVEPLSRDLWLGSIILFFYTWVVLWLLEFLGNNTNIPGEVPRKLGIMTFFSLFGDKDRVERLLSRIVLIVWVFFFLVLSASYTANLATMLTIRQLNPTITDIHELRKSGDYVGCIRGSYVERILEQLNFDGSKIKTYNTYDGFYSALSKGSKNGGIAAFIHEVPYIRLFLARNCKGYTMVPFYKAAGFGYAFPKGSPLVGDISKAILSVIGGDTINQIEKKWIGIGYQNNCNNAGRAPDPEKLTPDGFTGLFILSGAISTSSLLIAVAIYFYEKKNSTTETQPDQKGDQAEGNERGNEAGEEMQNIGLQPSGHRRNASAVSWGFRRSFGTRVAPVSSSSRF
ncbi:glutamate receptor 2.8-like [Triticum dicoccoides]|uniref:glutamate receptor 2.8-like n=1 Tax=Triticum dicoccoides TaxID=85692 RepID=UPI00188F69BE|nr:glutamate receptor 2.8-like [Triticum dicoccoides]